MVNITVRNSPKKKAIKAKKGKKGTPKKSELQPGLI